MEKDIETHTWDNWVLQSALILSHLLLASCFFYSLRQILLFCQTVTSWQSIWEIVCKIFLFVLSRMAPDVKNLEKAENESRASLFSAEMGKFNLSDWFSVDSTTRPDGEVKWRKESQIVYWIFDPVR